MNKLLLLSLGGIMLTACSQGANKDAVAEKAIAEKAVAEKVNASAVEVPSNLELRDDKLIPKQIEPKDAVQTGLLTGELQVTPDDGLSVLLSITNNQAYGVLIQYRSGMTADLQILDPQGEKVWAWSDDMMFTQALRDTSIASGQMIKVNFTVPESVLNNLKGRGYSLVAKYVGHATESNRVAMTDVTVSLDPYIN
ncbi:proteinase inhibitor [Shewanella canadensis]|uniref:Proteinase inhibitor n=1 Tax=Shewanella canadensis TaxID=271096 RepID=A0A3S0J4S8_9GAMM|nr:BsuPI-related putative proteinase inhibitor [Shewanella canadensis]RTR37954.1 proteinase inhibitor [Shewanella canadensis]